MNRQIYLVEPPNQLPYVSSQVSTIHSVTLTKEAIINYENKSYTFRVTDRNAYELIEVKPGVIRDGYVELTAGGHELRSFTFVTKGAYSLLMKMKNTGENDD